VKQASPCCGLVAAIAALLVPACGAPADPQAAVEAAPPPGADLLFAREGVPGSWWRHGASQDMFDAELGVCLARSKRARAAPGSLDPADAAYRSFLECMDRHHWVRGLPPKRERAPAEG
jgi:hypothetical protein